MIRLKLLKLFLKLLIISQGLSQNDDSFQSGKTGCDVGKLAIDHVVASGVFSKLDRFIYQHIGSLSDFGQKNVIPGATGIWQTTEANLKKAVGIMKKTKLGTPINDTLCVDFGSLIQDDMNVPINSLICAALLIEGEAKAVPLQTDGDFQAST